MAKKEEHTFQFISNDKGEVQYKISQNFKLKYFKKLFSYFFELSKIYNDDREEIELYKLDITFYVKKNSVTPSVSIEQLSLNEILFLINEMTEIFDKISIANKK